ncbi:MAG TPA: hypothetical protein VIC53_04245 [Wenzhouxiangella sp.]
MLDVEKNLLTTLLVAFVGVLGLVGLVFLGSFLRTHVDRIAPADEQAISANPVEAPDTGLEELGQYAAIIERPVFFPDRRLPVLAMAEENEEVDFEPIPEPDPIEPLKAVVAGIIITPEAKIAMVNDEVAGKVMVLREGMSLEGEQAAWQLSEITERKAEFVSVDGQRSALELQVYTEGLVAGDSGLAANTTQGDGAASGEQVDPEEAQSRADLIRQRVAERRAELRARAAERAQGQESTPEPEPEP